jgi:hypothetical protein
VPELKAITLIRPWAWAICHAGKRVENRSWHPPLKVIGQRIAVHAGKKYDHRDAEWIQATFNVKVPAESLQPTGIVATALLSEIVMDRDKPWTEHRRWYFGPYGWVLEDVRPLPEPIPCRGAQGLWDVPADIAERLT